MKNSFGMRFFLAWLSGSLGAYLLTGFFSNFHSSFWQFILLSVLFVCLCATISFLFLHGISEKIKAGQQVEPLTVVTLLIAFGLCLAALLISWQYPGLFPRRILFMDPSRLPIFALLALISLGLSLVLLNRLEQGGFTERFRRTRAFQITQPNLPGILLALFFLMTYLVFAQSMNFPGFRTLDQFFDTDISEWLIRLTSNRLEDASPVRAVHPAVLIFLRPPVWFLSLFLNGDRLQAVFLLNALAGAGCVLLAWLIVKRTSGNTTYALIMASILGSSSAHLLLSSMLETYIYSALALLFFTFLIQYEHTSLKFTVPAGILVFGITVTNLIQTCILYFFKVLRLKVLIKYILIVVALTALLNLLQVGIFPNARSLFQPANYEREGYYVWNPLDLSWRTIGRFSLIARAIPLYGVVAPTPFVLKEELAVEYPNFRTYQILLGEFHVAGYRGLADVTVKLWMVILVAAGAGFLLNLIRSPKQMMFPLSLLLCLGFSFTLHVVYGDDPMLYSPNWVYALVLFVAASLQGWGERRWLQAGLIVFLILLVSANLGLMRQILDVSAPYFGNEIIDP